MILDALGPTVISARCPQHDQLIERCAQPRGFVLVHAHVGCFQIGASTLTQFPKRVSIVMIPEPGSKAPATIIDPHSGLLHRHVWVKADLRPRTDRTTRSAGLDRYRLLRSAHAHRA